MQIFYSRTKRAFFCEAVHGEQIPKDAVAISEEQYTALMVAQNSGKVIEPDAAGCPQAVTPTISAEQLSAQLKGEAQDALDASDRTLLRCLERGLSLPEAWVNYRAQLREVVNGTMSTMPERPEYPSGS